MCILPRKVVDELESLVNSMPPIAPIQGKIEINIVPPHTKDSSCAIVESIKSILSKAGDSMG